MENNACLYRFLRQQRLKNGHETCFADINLMKFSLIVWSKFTKVSVIFDTLDRLVVKFLKKCGFRTWKISVFGKGITETVQNLVKKTSFHLSKKIEMHREENIPATSSTKSWSSKLFNALGKFHNSGEFDNH